MIERMSQSRNYSGKGDRSLGDENKRKSCEKDNYELSRRSKKTQKNGRVDEKNDGKNEAYTTVK